MTERDLWIVVLAGGEGRRLRPLVEQIYGDARPKQFARPLGRRGMLDQTLERMRPLVPVERTIVVTVESQRQYLPAALARHRGVQVMIQPGDRGTAAAILWPSLRIAALDPEAQVLIVPSDHFVGDEHALRHQLRAAAERHATRPVLFGVAPESAESDYGWIELDHGGDNPGEALLGVRGFVEKPDRMVAAACFDRGDLWNTMLVLADARSLIEVMALAQPDLVSAFGPIRRSASDVAVEAAYAAARPADFSGDVLAAVPGCLSAWRLPELRWSDLGTVDRVLDRLRVEGREPWWRSSAPPGHERELAPVAVRSHRPTIRRPAAALRPDR